MSWMKIEPEDPGLQVMALDPGETTGWAIFWVPTANLLSREVGLFDDAEYDCGQITGPEEVQTLKVKTVMQGLMSGPLIIEDFILRQFRQDKSLLSPVRVTAMVEYMLYEQNWNAKHPVRKQQPALAKTTATDERLRDWGLWEAGAPHARDAIRHAVTFLRRAKTDPRLRRWGWPEAFR
jgi:hypothetical protein